MREDGEEIYPVGRCDAEGGNSCATIFSTYGEPILDTQRTNRNVGDAGTLSSTKTLEIV